MSAIKGYTYIRQNDNNSYRCFIWDEIQKGALSNFGKAFSFELRLVTQECSFKSEPRVFGKGNKWVRIGTDSYNNLVQFQKAFQQYKKHLSLSLEYGCLVDERTSSGPIAKSQHGYVAVINVPEEYSQEIYKTYAQAAMPFRDRLLAQHKQLLIQMTNSLIDAEPGTPNGEWILGCVFVSPDSIYNQHHDRDDVFRRHIKTFADFGMSPLVSVQQCYGVALALMEIYQTGWAQFGVPKLEISVDHGENHSYINDEFIAIKLQYSVKREKPEVQLNPW